MTYYKPCKNCAADKTSCQRRADIASAISGMSVTVVNFRCSERQPLFHTGQRVALDWTAWEQDGSGDNHAIGLIYHGTVVQEHGSRFIVRVDDGQSADAEQIAARDTFKNDNLVIKVKPSDMRPLDEPDRNLCPACSGYDGEQGRCQGWGGPDFASYWPDGCLIAGAARGAQS